MTTWVTSWATVRELNSYYEVESSISAYVPISQSGKIIENAITIPTHTTCNCFTIRFMTDVVKHTFKAETREISKAAVVQGCEVRLWNLQT